MAFSPLKKTPRVIQTCPAGGCWGVLQHLQELRGVQRGTLLVSGCSTRGCCWSPHFTSTLSPTGPVPSTHSGVQPTAPHGPTRSCGSHKPGSPTVSRAPPRHSVSG